jgi:UDP-N-acetylmuramyl tripeptide synthase
VTDAGADARTAGARGFAPRQRLGPALFGALVAAKAAGHASRIVRAGGGTSFPGVVARRIAPDVLSRIHVDSGVPSVFITGSNGKTTTTRFVTALLRGEGLRVVTNAAGANLVQGFTTMVVEAADLYGRLGSRALVAEIDEGAVAGIVSQLSPDVLLVTDLFRDQLDRFGELYAVARLLDSIAEALPDDATWLVNADDPLLASLAADRKGPRLTFGLELGRSTDEITRAADTIRCPRCRADLEYRFVYLSHLGDYRCPACGFARPAPDVAVTALDTTAMDRTAMTIRTPNDEITLSIPQGGTHIAYNAAAAIAALVAVRQPMPNAAQSLAAVTPAFGRLERIKAGERDIILAFVKNPTSCNTTLRTLAVGGEPRHLLIAMSSSLVDGEDFAWLWDVDFESMVSRVAHATIAGTRADELANRLKYAGLPVEAMRIENDPRTALDAALSELPAGMPLVILAGYTPTIEFHQEMQRRGWVGPYWEASRR